MPCFKMFVVGVVFYVIVLFMECCLFYRMLYVIVVVYGMLFVVVYVAVLLYGMLFVIWNVV